MFAERAFTLAKDVEHPEEDQDAFRMDAARGMAVIADGVASAIFSRQWAAILTEAVLDDTPNPHDKEAFASWLAACRQDWQRQIDVSGLAWFQKAKMRQGAFSTLLWMCLTPADEDRQPPEGYRLAGFAIGDSCLFHVRGGEVLRTFPITSAAELDANPLVIGSMDLKRDDLLEFQLLEADCLAGDLLVLCTDAIAHWALQRQEKGEPPDWQRYWNMTEENWRQEVIDLRSEREMRYDDATLVLLRVAGGKRGQNYFPGNRGNLPRTDAKKNSSDPFFRQEDETPITAEAAEAVEENEVDRPVEQPIPVEVDWKERLKSVSEQFSEQFSEQVSRGLDKMKEVSASAETAIRKYRDKWRSHDK